MTPARLQAPWRRCAQCGAVHAQSYCRWCEESTPTIPVLVDDPELEAALRQSDAASVVSSPLRKRGSAVRPG